MRIDKAKMFTEMQRNGIRHFGDLAKRVGVHHVTMSQWVSGVKDPSWSALERLCGVLHCTIDAIVSYEDDPKVAALASEPNYGAVGAVA